MIIKHPTQPMILSFSPKMRTAKIVVINGSIRELAFIAL